MYASVTNIGFNRVYLGGKLHADGLIKERPNSSALAMEVCVFCTMPSIYAGHGIDMRIINLSPLN